MKSYVTKLLLTDTKIGFYRTLGYCLLFTCLSFEVFTVGFTNKTQTLGAIIGDSDPIEKVRFNLPYKFFDTE